MGLNFHYLSHRLDNININNINKSIIKSMTRHRLNNRIDNININNIIKSMVYHFWNYQCNPGGMDHRGHSRILIKGVQNTHRTCLIVGNDGNCKGLRY